MSDFGFLHFGEESTQEIMEIWDKKFQEIIPN